MRKILAKITALVFTLTFVLGAAVAPASAATLTGAKDVISSSVPSAAGVSHTVTFNIPATGVSLPVATAKIQLSTANFAFADGTVVLNTVGPSDNVVIASNIITLDGDVLVNGDTDAGSLLFITGLTATNPVAGTYSIIVKTDPNGDGTYTDGDSVTVMVQIVDSVAVTASVASTFSFSIADEGDGEGSVGTEIALGALNTGAVAKDGNDLTISTNAANGYAVTVKETQQMQTPAAVTLARVAGNNTNVVAGTEGYGISTEIQAQGSAGSATTVETGVFAVADDDIVDTTADEIVSAPGPVANAIMEVMFKVGISGLTDSGDYSTSLIYVATPQF